MGSNLWSWQRAQWAVRLTKVEMVVATMSSRSSRRVRLSLAVPSFEFLVADEVPGAGGEEAGEGERRAGSLGCEEIAGELFADEAVVGLVLVEGCG
jgi:hypothetical protein